MKRKLKIRQKILLYILTVTAVLYVASMGYILWQSRMNIYNDAIEKTQLAAKVSAKEVGAIFEKELSLVRTLSQAFTVYKNMPHEQWKKLFLDMYIPVLRENPEIYSIWDSWEYKTFIPDYDKDYGRFIITTWREGNEIKWLYDERSMNGDPPIYAKYKKLGRESIWEPYVDQVTTGKADIKLMITYCSPIYINNAFSGIVASDVSLESLQEMVSKIKPVKGSFAYLISHEGIIAAHPSKDFINKKVEEVLKDDNIKERITQRISKGEEFYYTTTDETGRQLLICHSPIIAGKTTTPWSLALSVPVDVIMANVKKTFYVSLFVSITGLLAMVLVLLFVSDNLTKPIKRITDILKRMAKGEVSEELKVELNTGDEIEEMALALNTTIDGIGHKTTFANEIGKGNYETNPELLSNKDVLGKSLIHMRDSLKKAAEEEEKRKVEDQKRSWANEGFAKFGEILRQNNNDLQKLCDSVIAALVKYVGANQGGIFLWNDEDKTNQFFELISAFAWDRKKYLTKQIEKGEGLVGACAMEKETIFLTDVPDDYVNITSGLGDANPRCVILVPLKHEDEVLGVIEMASFKVLEKHEIEFIEKIAESIAATILSVKINARTKMLLEQSQMQAEEMKAQEEEMRQNMEELQATQEEVERKSAEIEEFIKSIQSSAYVIEYDLNGNILNVNDSFVQFIGIPREQIVGSHHSDNLELFEVQKKEYGTFWDNLKAGISKKVKSTITWKGKTYHLLETYIPVKDSEGRVYKIMKLAFEDGEFK
ncbi:MAG TPA: HAMP domain-containing protein [Bacteroidales bacterium]|mgnify:CR=1 FL=1|nr:HAMP domain-containing protein [Bacteroidales bacterium]